MTRSDSVRNAFPPPHQAGYPFLAGGVAAIVLGLLVGTWLSWVGVAFTLACLLFFRDPERVAPGRLGVVLAPADGTVVSVSPAIPPPELGLGDAPRWRVATFLSVLNVHVNRVPADGVVAAIAYRHGAFVSASHDKSADSNERNAVAIRLPDGRAIAVVQIAGLIARRIVCDLVEGEPVHAGARFGIIRFGSRTDLYLPEGVRPLVVEGQTMTGGETVIAELGA